MRCGTSRCTVCHSDRDASATSRKIVGDPPALDRGTAAAGEHAHVRAMKSFYASRVTRPPYREIPVCAKGHAPLQNSNRSEEHTSELQSRQSLVCRLLL